MFLPEWYMPPDAPRHSLPTDSDRTAFFAAFLKEHPEISDEIPITAIRITGSGFSRLSHRDYMGSVLALGIDRSVIGDIVPVSEREAVVFAEEKIAPYIMSSLDKIGRDGVSVTRFSPDPEWVIPRRFSEMTLSLSSMRLDCIVKALTNLSREAAAETVRAGLVELSYSTDDNVSSSVKSGDIISVRGFGKFLIGDTDGETKSGRLRVRRDVLEPHRAAPDADVIPFARRDLAARADVSRKSSTDRLDNAALDFLSRQSFSGILHERQDK